MIGWSYGSFFQVTVAGRSYQKGLVTHLQGVPAGIHLQEEDIYFDLLQRKPGQSVLSLPRRDGAGLKVKDMTGCQCNNQMFLKNGAVTFSGNNSVCLTGGFTTGQDIVARLAIQPTPTIVKTQKTIDKVNNTSSMRRIDSISRKQS